MSADDGANLPHWLYIFRDSAGAVLYVGCTAYLGRRMTAHHGDKAWWAEIATVEAQVYPNRASGRIAEIAAIREHLPRYERSQAMRTLNGDLPSLPCRTCHRGKHRDCVGTNKRGEPCPCKVCADLIKAAS